MSKRNKYNTVIIGAGSIGALYDRPGSPNFLTHAHAFSSHPGFRLLGFVDNNADQAKKAAKKWKCGYGALREMLSRDVDIVCVAVPDEYHFDVMKAVSKYPVRLVFLEKPVAQSLKDAETIRNLYKNRSVCVNYRRRFVPEFISLGRSVRQGEYGKLITGTGYYGKGILHNGSHLIDLIRLLAGEITGFEPAVSYRDFKQNDPTVSGMIKLDNGVYFHLQGVPSDQFTIFEMDLLYEKKRVRITDSGFRIEFQEPKKDPVFKGYRNITIEDSIKTSLNRALFHAADDIYRHLSIGTSLHSDLDEGYKNMEACIRILKKSS